ncbi:YceI family protein [Roseovarius sp.]|jgi:polyisoprenoid-binding protein YceI
MNRRSAILGQLALCAIALPGAGHSAPQRYRLDTARSTVAFTYRIGDAVNTGQMPVKSADMRLDLDNVPASRVDVVLDAGQARAGFFLATQALRDANVLDTDTHPEIRFRSTRITGDLSGATITGDLTVRGITRAVTLDAGLYRQRGTQPGDRDNLTVLLTGSVSRSAFGATGYAGLVGDTIGIRIVARITK